MTSTKQMRHTLLQTMFDLMGPGGTKHLEYLHPGDIDVLQDLGVAEAARFNGAVQDASDAFWEKLASAYPHVDTGDMSPEATMAFESAVARAAYTWLINNDAFDRRKLLEAVAEKLRRRCPQWTVSYEHPGFVHVGVTPRISWAIGPVQDGGNGWNGQKMVDGDSPRGEQETIDFELEERTPAWIADSIVEGLQQYGY